MTHEILLGTMTVLTAGITTGLPSIQGQLVDWVQLGALAIVLIITLSYIFKIFLPNWQASNEKRFSEQSETFKETLKVLVGIQEKQSSDTKFTVDQIKSEIKDQRIEFQIILTTQQKQYQETLDKITTDNFELWKSERDRFSENYSRLIQASDKLSDNICDVLEKIKK